MNRERLLIYPYTKENLSLIQYIVLHMNQYEVSSVVSPNGWGLVGKDVGEVVYREKMNLIVESDYDASLKKCDTVLFCDYDNEGLNIKQSDDEFSEKLANNIKKICDASSNKI